MINSFERWLQPSGRTTALVDPIFRVTTSLIFIIGGLGHFGQHAEMLARVEESPWHNMVTSIGDPSLLLWLSGGVFVIFGVTLALGLATRLSAILLFVTLVPITIAIHVAPGHVGPLFKNIAILGALLHFYANGPGRFSLDPNANRQNGSVDI
jgi:putative oxidoreductase